MATDPLWIDASSGAPAYSGAELRLNGVTPFMAGVGASLGVRSGVRPSGSGTDLQVAAQTSPNMTVRVFPGVAVVQGAISTTQGAYSWSLDATTNITISAAHATLSRTDRICVRVRDASVDTSGQRDGGVVVVTGTAGAGVPSLPTDASYLEIARITVAAAVTSIVTGAITDMRQFTAALGGIIPATSATEPAASTVPASQVVCRTDMGNVLRYAPDGANYRMIAPYRTTTILSGTTASVTFSGLPAGMKNVVVKITARGDAAAVTGILCMRVNGDTGANYYVIRQVITNTTGANGNDATQTYARVGTIASASAAANHFGQAIIELAGMSLSSHMLNFSYRSVTYPSQATSALEIGGGVYNTTGPYTSITFLPLVGSFVAGSEFTLDAWDN